MELKTILAIGLVVFIVGALIFLKIKPKKKKPFGAAKSAAPFTYPEKQKRRQKSWFISLIRT